MSPQEALVRELFDRLAAGDAEGAARCYHPEIFYSDPVFSHVRGAAVADLWRLRRARLRGAELRLDAVHAEDGGVIARWTARYERGARRVVVRGRSMFAFRDGRISRHYDYFSFWRWAAQAYGARGAALGWFAGFKWKVRRDAALALERLSDRADR